MESSIQVPKFRIGSRQIDIFPYWIGLLLLGMAFGLVGAYQVLRYGLQVTGLSNQVSWGLWIVIDLSAIALGGGAFTLGVIVYLFRIKRFENVGKLAVLMGFLGYSTAGMVIFFDIGQPFRLPYPVIFWQPHSLLWEITMCVVLYLTVLVLELFPTVMEHPLFDRYPVLGKIAHRIHGWSPILATIGLTLSLLHQASLGATYGVLSGRGLWFSPSAPVMFVTSAIGGGMAGVFLLSLVVFRAMRPGVVPDTVLYDVARVSGVVILASIYLVVWDWAVTQYYSFDNEIAMQVELLNKVAPYSTSFWLGQVLVAVVPGLVLLTSKNHRNLRLTAFAAALVVIYVLVMRWNYNFSGLTASISIDPFTPSVRLNSYLPTWQEFAVATLVICYWLMGFSLAARFLPFGSRKDHGEHGAAH